METDNNVFKIEKELVQLIQGGNAHGSFADAVREIPTNLRSTVPSDLPYSIWQLVEHIRIAQWDIVEFCVSGNHKSPKWPDEYWVSNPEMVDDETWNKTLIQIETDKNRFIELLKEKDIFSEIPHGDRQTVFREALLIADHTSYHTGQIIVLRRLLNIWEE